MPRTSKLDRSVAGRTVIVTGAASGMGRATAHLFADEGANVAVCDFNADGAQRVAGEVTDAGGTARAWAVDVADGAAVRDMIAEVAEAFGGLDILVNNAGISAAIPIDAENYDELWARCLAVDLTALTLTIRAALPYLRQSNSPRIINIASTEGLGATGGHLSLIHI